MEVGANCLGSQTMGEEAHPEYAVQQKDATQQTDADTAVISNKIYPIKQQKMKKEDAHPEDASLQSGNSLPLATFLSHSCRMVCILCD